MTTKNFVVKNGLEAGNITLNGLNDLITTTGNVSAANILTSGIVSAAGNITAGNISTSGTVTSNNLNVNNIVSNVLANGDISAIGNVFFTGANFYLANVSNVHIPGGSANYVLTTDGTGNLSWQVTGSGNGNANVAGTNTQIQFNDDGNLGASANLTFDKSTNTFATYSVNVTGNLNFTGPNAYFSNVSNVKIPGGTANYVLTTDGTGNVSWEPTGRGDANVAGNNTEVQFNDSGNLGASANFTFNKSTNTLTATFLSGDGSNLANLAGANVTGTVANATHASTANVVTDGTQSNITAVGTLTSLSSSGNIDGANILTTGIVSANGNVTGNYILGNGYYLTGVITSSTSISNGNSNVTVEENSNVTVSIAGNANVLVFTGTGANVNGYLYATGNITGANGNLGNLVSANYFSGSGNNLSNIQASNITGTVANANYAAYAGDVINASQPNITSVGTLSNLSVSGNVDAGNVNTGIISANGNLTAANANLGNAASANYFIGSGNNLSNIQASNITGTIANANYAAYAGDVVNATQSNITTVGTLTNLSVTGNANIGNDVNVTGNAVITGNLVVGGNTVYVNVETIRVEDPIIELGGGPNGDPLTSDDGKDRGTLLHYYSGAAIDAFIGWDLSNSEFAMGSNVSVTNEVVTFNTLGNLRIQSLAANIGNFSGNIIAANANLGNVVSANYFIGSGNNLSNIQGGNVTGQVGNAAIADSVYSNSQPNITSVGTLSSLSVSGTVTSGNAVLGNTANANYFYGNGYYLTDLNPGNIGTVANANYAAYAGDIVNASQPNITSVGTLTSLSSTGNANVANVNTGNVSATGNITSANANLGNAATANYFIGSGNNLSNIQGANVTGTVANATHASTANTVVDASQPNITSVGILTSLSVSGNIIGNSIESTFSSGQEGGEIKLAKPVTSNINGGIVVDVYNDRVRFFESGGTNRGAYIDISSASAGVGSNLLAGSGIQDKIANGNSNVYIPNANGNVTITSAGNANVVVVTGTGVNIAGYANITGNLIVANANLGNAAIANYFIGSGNNLSNILLANISGIGNIATVNLDGNASNVLYGNGIFAPAASPYGDSNVASFLASYGSNTITTTGNVSVGNIIGNGQALTGISGANVTGEVSYANTANNVAVANVSGLGNIATLNLDGNTSNVLYGNGVFAPATSPYDDSNVATFLASFGSNTITTTGNVSVGNIIGNGQALTGINGANVTGEVANANYAAYAGNITIAGQSNITSVGTLTSLSVSGNANVTDLNVSGNAVITGNLTVSGTTEYINVTNLAVKDPIIGIGRGTNNAPLTTDDGKDRGEQLWYYSGSEKSSFIGYDNSAGKLIAATDVTISSEVVTVNTYGNFVTGGLEASTVSVTGNIETANYVLGNGYYLTGLSVGVQDKIANGNSNVYIPTANGNVTITSAGNANVVVITGTGVSIAGNINANVITGNGSGLTNLAGGNVTGQVANALVAGTVYTAAQPNITSVGTLTGLTVGPNSSIILSGNTGYVRANSIQGRDGSQAIYPYYDSISGAVGIVTDLTVGVSGGGNLTVANGNVAFSGANVSLGNVSNLHITGGTLNYFLKTDGSGNLSWAQPEAAPGGGAYELQFNDFGVFAGTANLLFDTNEYRLSIQNYSLVVQALGGISGATVIDITDGCYVSATAAGITTWIFTFPAPSGNACGFVLELTNGGTYTQNWPLSVRWPGGVAPELTATGTDVLIFITRDNGTTWRGAVSMLDSI